MKDGKTNIESELLITLGTVIHIKFQFAGVRTVRIVYTCSCPEGDV